MDKQKHKLLIDEFAENCPCKDEWCSVRELVMNLFKDPRTLCQAKCIEKFKYEKSKELNRDIGKEAGKDWVETGWAEKFSSVYSEDKTISQIYKEIKAYINCVEKYKFEKSKEVEHDIGWEIALKEWKEMYGEKFNNIYNEEKTIGQIYKEIKNGGEQQGEKTRITE